MSDFGLSPHRRAPVARGNSAFADGESILPKTQTRLCPRPSPESKATARCILFSFELTLPEGKGPASRSKLLPGTVSGAGGHTMNGAK